MNEYDENTRALIQARVIPGPLPEPYDRVIEELSAEEVEALISIKNRLEEVHRREGGGGEFGHMGMVVPL